MLEVAGTRWEATLTRKARWPVLDFAARRKHWGVFLLKQNRPLKVLQLSDRSFTGYTHWPVNKMGHNFLSRRLETPPVIDFFGAQARTHKNWLFLLRGKKISEKYDISIPLQHRNCILQRKECWSEQRGLVRLGKFLFDKKEWAFTQPFMRRIKVCEELSDALKESIWLFWPSWINSILSQFKSPYVYPKGRRKISGALKSVPSQSPTAVLWTKWKEIVQIPATLSV